MTRAGRWRMRVGWALMGWPVGWRRPKALLLRFGPYRVGGVIFDSGMAAERRANRD